MKKAFITGTFLLFFLSVFYAYHVNYQQDSEAEFGPFFLPEDNTLSSISINYLTSAPSETVVLFSMVGDLDWARTDYNNKTYHKMIFSDIEEEAEYQFKIPGEHEKLTEISTISTRPYGDSYYYEFAIANIDSDFELKDVPSFLVLLSDEESLDRAEFQSFYEDNSELLSSTIIVPMFELIFDDRSISYDSSGVYLVKYKKLNLILVHEDISDRSLIGSLLSHEEDEINVLVFGNLDEESIQEITYQYVYDIAGYFTYADLGLTGALPVNDALTIGISSDPEETFELVTEAQNG